MHPFKREGTKKGAVRVTVMEENKDQRERIKGRKVPRDLQFTQRICSD